MKYGLHIDLQFRGPGDIAEAAESVVEEFAALEACTGMEHLLDFSLGTDATENTVEVEITVEADTLQGAIDIGLSALRSAIHATGAGTPGWDDAPAKDYVTSYAIDEQRGLEVRPLMREPVSA